MTGEEVIRIAQGLIRDFKCESETMVEFCNVVIKALKQEPCENAISRQAVDEIKELMTDINGDTVYAVRMSDIRQLSSVNPQPICEEREKGECPWYAR